MKNTRLGVLAAVDDVGAGIAQIVPILVAGFDSCQTAVEQPELHLHPKLQVQVADFFLSAWNLRLNRSIIETHSEYLALRLLRRIRETSKADIRHREFSLDIGDIAFYYFNPIDGETKVTNLRASPDGEFIDRWPKGFFAEREAELFDEDD